MAVQHYGTSAYSVTHDLIILNVCRKQVAYTVDLGTNGMDAQRTQRLWEHCPLGHPTGPPPHAEAFHFVRDGFFQ